MPVDRVWALQVRAKADAAADRKHQDLLDRIRASLEASRAAVKLIQKKDRASAKNAPRS
jgi:hypothetical protein